MQRPPHLLRAALFVSFLVAAPGARAQVVYSIDWKGPTIAQPDTGGGVALTESDLVLPGGGMPAFGPLRNPQTVVTGGQLGLIRYTMCLGHEPGVPCGVELDALSTGADARYGDDFEDGTAVIAEVWFSTDEWARGIPSPPGSPGHDSLDVEATAQEASADLFVPEVSLPGPVQPPFPLLHSVATMDGDGLRNTLGYVKVGLGLVEPNPAAVGLPNAGDNLDALDIGFPAAFPATGVLFSLDAGFVDPRENVPNSGSAAATGFSGADVLRSLGAGTPPTVYASAQLLGLDRAGVGTDDVDAIAVAENGDFVFQPSQVPFDWLPGPGGAPRDMLLFSVRRGSAVIGRPDSLFGAPIEEGDVLTTPVPPGMGGMSPFPAIFLPAESLGLRTVRSGTAMLFGDDLNALDTTAEKCFDCNGNGVEDAVDIATGASTDVNGNGIPDECEPRALAHCFCHASVAPCANEDAEAGCANSTGLGGFFESVAGDTSVGTDDLVLSSIQLPVNKPGLVYMGGGHAQLPFGDGLRCAVSGGMGVHRFPVQNTGTSGTLSLGPGIAAYACAQFNPNGCISPGDTWHFQAWYRDPTGPCGGTFNLSNAVQVEFVP